MYDLGRMLKIIIFDIIPSFWDMTTDFMNAISMISRKERHTFNATITNDTYNTYNTFNATITNDTFIDGLDQGIDNSTYVYTEDVIWGSLGICFIFAPGIPTAVLWLVNDDNWKKMSEWFKAIVLPFFYPLMMLFYQVAAFCDPEMSGIIVSLIAGEAFFEATPQLALQGFTILYGYDTDRMQIISVCCSFLLLAKSAIMFDLDSMNIMFSPCSPQHWMYLLAVVPFYASGIVFRIGSMTVIMAYWRYLAIIPIAMRVIMYMGLTKKFQYYYAYVPIAVIANIGSVTRGTLGGTDRKDSFNFLVASTIGTMFFEIVCLTVTLTMAQFSPSYFPHWQTRLTYFHYTVSLIVVLIGVGMVNLMLLLVTSEKLENPPISSKDEGDDDEDSEK